MTDEAFLRFLWGLVIFLVVIGGVLFLLGRHAETKGRIRLRIGDKAPQELLDHKEGDGNLGAFVVICPHCKRIDDIWHP